MKLWLVDAAECDYDEYDAFVIRAETEAEAITMVTSATSPCGFNGHQSPFTCVEIPVDGEPEIILGSYNAG